MVKRVVCQNCECSFFPEDGVSLDDCPKCGRTVEVKPAPAPLPGSEELAEALAEISAAGFGGVAEGMRLHITDLTRRLAEVEAERDSEQRWASKYAQESHAAEAHVRELEATIDAMAEAHAHDDQALTAAYLSGAHAGKKQAEAERDALRERCGKLEAALVEIGNSEDRICGYCEGEGNRYADGKAHYYSEHAPTIPCPECGGRGRIRDMDSEDMAAVANAALATEVEP